MDPESWAEALGLSSPGGSGSGVVLIVALSSIFFLPFLVFCGVGGVGGDFSISQ